MKRLSQPPPRFGAQVAIGLRVVVQVACGGPHGAAQGRPPAFYRPALELLTAYPRLEE